MRNTMQISYLKLGENKGAKRLWVQGRRLAASGFHPGVTYDVSYEDDGALSITIKPDGAHKVSSKKQGDAIVPVIDLNNRTLERVFGSEVTRVRAVIGKGEIRVTIHPDDVAAKERLDRLTEALESGRPLAVGSVAHGGGVLDHALHEGFKRGGVKTELAFAIEIERDYLEASLANNPVWTDRSVAIHAPMEEVEPALLGKVEIMAGGLPCQGASLAGKAKNGNRTAEEHATAGPLFIAFLQIIKAVNPAIVLLEQVPPYQSTVSMAVIRQVLEKWGYEVTETILDESMGALETRKRLCVVATTKGLSFDWRALVPVRRKEETLAEVLEDLPDDDPRWKTYSYLADKEQRDMAAGKGFRTQVLSPEATSCGTIGRGYQKARSTEARIRHPRNPSLSRLLTPREHARVKTCPEQLVDGVSDTTAHEVLGQSVIHVAFVAVGQLLAESILRLVRGTHMVAVEAVRAIEKAPHGSAGASTHDSVNTEGQLALPI